MTNKPLRIPSYAGPGWQIMCNGVLLTLDENRELKAPNGTTYAAMDERNMSDDVNLAGAAGIYLSEDNVLSKAAPMHEFMTSSTTYQRYHTNIEATAHYLANAAQLAEPGLRDRFWLWIGKLALKQLNASDRYWDNKSTLGE